jgi:hypothetical protein
MNTKSLTLAGCVATGLAMVLCACGGSSTQAAGSTSASAAHSSAKPSSAGSSQTVPSSAGPSSAGPSSAGPSSTAPAQTGAIPAGDHVVGGAAQGISIAVPSSWVAISLTQDTINQLSQKFHMGDATAAQLIHSFDTLQKDHGLIVFDLKSAFGSAAHFATNLNAYCLASGVNNTGSSAVAILRQGVPEEFGSIGATHIAMQDISVGGVPGLETTYTVSSSAGTLYSGQLEVLPKPDRGCFVTLTGSKGYFPLDVLTVAAATAHFFG